MKIESAVFVKCAAKKEQYPKERLPEVAFAGKSNVGKSSLINRLLNRKGLVKTSSTPGKTQTINFFRINDAYMFVDLPGYGYARVPMTVKRSWATMIETYLMDREQLKLVVSLLDIRRKPDEEVIQLSRWFRHYEIPFLTVITKTDKVRKSEVAAQREKIVTALGMEPDHVILCSAKTGLGKKEILNAINLYIRN